MKVEIVIPEMGESITEGTIVKWLKKPGDKVRRNEALLEISTDKVDTEIPSPQDGVLAEILVEEGETVSVGTTIAHLETDKRAAPDREERPAEEEETEEREEPEKKKAEKKAKKTEEEEAAEEVERVGEEARSRRLSPVARAIAEKEGLSEKELSGIEGTGFAGRLTKADVLGYLKAREEAEEEPMEKEEEIPSRAPVSLAYDRERVTIQTMSTMRRKIAEHMVYSKRTSPHVYTAAEVDVTRIVNFREKVKGEFEKREGFKLTYTPFVLYATVQALKSWRVVNASVDGDRIVYKHYINLGVAVALEDGLIVPVIKNADEKNLLGLARALQDLVMRARDKKLKPEEVQDGTFTVTNPGVFGNIFGLPVINQPQLGILGVGAVKKRPVVIHDAIAIRSMMYLTLSYDHRVIDGAVAGQFVQEIGRNLEQFEPDSAL